MSSKDDLLKLIDPGKVVSMKSSSKKKKNESATTNKSASVNGNSKNSLLQQLDVAPIRMSSLGTYSGLSDDDDIAPVKDSGKLDFFQKGAFESGVNLKSVSQAILGTAGDVGVGLFKGLANLSEGIGDFISYRSADVIEAAGDESKADRIRRRAQKNFYNDKLQGTDDYLDQYSVLGRTSDSLMEGLGLVGGIAATGGLGAAAGLGSIGTTLLTSSAMFATSAGSAQGEAYMSGATDEEAIKHAMNAGAADALSELLFAGLGKPLKAVGIGAGLSSVDDILAKKVSNMFSNQIAKNMAQFGVKATAEGLEEVIAGVAQAISKKNTYMSEEDFADILRDENLLEQFIVGAVTSGLLQSGVIPGTTEGSVIEANRKGSDFITGLSKNEMTVIDKVVQDEIAAKEKDGKKLTNKEKNAVREDVIRKMDRGEISTDTIEELFGGDTYKTYQDAVAEEETALKELSELYKGDELKQQIEIFKENSKLPGIRQQLSEEVSKFVSKDRLIESYFERGRGSQKFEADITKYDEKQRAVIQSAIDSGILNNKRRTHEMVDLIAKISADKGVPFDFTNNEQIANSSFAVEGATVNGYVTEDGHITLNVESPKYLNTTVGHEITHVLEGTELYETLQNTLFEYAKGRKAKDSKFENEYMERLYNARNLYKNVKGYQGVDGFNKVKNEVAADLVGEYLFTDDAFIRKLSVENRNIFEKIYDEIKYLCKIVTAGSKEARELERVRKVFEDAYRSKAKPKTETKGETKGEVSVSEKTEGGGALDDVFAMKHVNNTTADMIINSAELTKAFKDITGITLTGTTVDKRKMIRDAVRMRQQLKAQGDAAAIKAAEKANAEYATEQETKAAELAAKTAQAVAENELDVLRTSGYASYIRGIFKNGATVADAREILSNPGMRAAWENVTNKTLPANEKSAIKMIMETKRNPDNIDLPKYSLSDSDGRQLTKEQQTYFKDSKVRDESGALKVMYHGTPNGDFTVFKDGTYFTDNKEYADRYHSTSASSISSGKTASNPKTFEVYLDIKKPFDINDAEARDIYINEYIKGGNAMGINPYLSDAEYDKITTIDWTEGEDLRDFIIDNGYDYDGLVLDEGADGGYGDEVKYRGKSYVIFSPEQAKNIGNAKPTTNPDIRFSLSESVEETKDLIAMHNVFPNKLMDALKLGGLPSPSIAITKKDIVHDNYGPISMLLHKESIDPEADSRNKVYGSDAWTPTSSNARTEYEVDYDKMRSFEKRLAELSKKTAGGAFVSESLVRRLGIEDVTEYNAAEAARRLAAYDEVRAAYLAEKGKTIEPEYKAKVYSKFGNKPLQTYIDRVGVQHLASVVAESYTGEMAAIRGEEATVRQIIRDNYAEERAYALNRRPELKEQRINKYMENNVSAFTIEDFVKAAWQFYEEGGAVTEEVDRMATSDKLREAVTEKEIIEWLEPQIEEFFGEPGIYNGKDVFTRSGKRRSFAETHYSYTAENIVKAMQQASDRGETWGGVNANTIIATATPSYGSIDEIRADKGRLMVEDKAAYDQILADIDDSLSSIESDIIRTTKHHTDNMYDEEQIIGGIIAEAASGTRTAAAVQKAFSKEGYKISADQAKRILHLYNQAAAVPTGYFESKPQRVVGFDEVAVVVIPYDSDAKLKQELLNNGLSIAEYDPNVEGDRQRVVNQFEDLAFSLSNVGETPTTFGNYHVSGKDVMYTPEDIAPVRADSGGVITDNAKVVTDRDDVAPVKIAPEKKQEAAKVLTEMPQSKKKFKLLSWAKEHLLDNGMVFEDLAKKTKNRELDAKWNFIRNAESAAQHLIGNGKGDAPALKKLMDTVNKSGKTEKFYQYLLHMHNVDRMSLAQRYPGRMYNKAVFSDGIGPDFSQKEADKLLKENPEFLEWAQDVYAFNEHLRGMLVENGVITQETADLWSEMYPHYVPIYRVGKDGKIVSDPNSKHTGVNAPLKKATGGNQPIEPLFDAMARRTIQTYKAIAKNNFGIELMNTLGSVVDSADGNAAEDADNFARDLDMVDLLAQGEDGGNPTFTVFENGKRVTFEITNEMYEAMKPKSEILAQKIPGLYHVSSIFRGLTTQYNPVFALTNPIKDIQDVLMNSQHPGKTYGNIPRAIAQMASNGQYYQEYLENGGHNNTYFDTEAKTFTEESKAKQLLDKVFAFNDYIEMTPRLAEYIASREAGRSIEESMLDAARVTTNFAAGGDVTKFANRNGATFLNASVQGAIQQVRNVRDAHQKGLMGYVGLATKIAVAGLPSILLNNMLWDDDEEYEELSDYVKQNYYVVYKYDDGRFLRIPKGRTLAVIQNAFDQVSGALTGDDEIDLGEFLKLAAENIAPNNPFENNILAPIKQIRENKTWYGEDLIPSRLQDLPAAEQYDEKTDSLSRWIGEKTNTSPYKWNYALNQYSGGLGDIFLPMMTPKAESGNDTFLGTLAAPFVDKFTTDSVLNNQIVTDFYDKKDEISTLANSKDATEEDLFKDMYMTSISYDTSDLYAQKREIQNSDLPNSEKYEKVREIQEQINELMEEAMSNYNHPKIDGLYAEVGDRRYNFSEENGQWYEITPKNYKGEDNYFYQREQEIANRWGVGYADYWNNQELYNEGYYAATSYGKNLLETAGSVFGGEAWSNYAYGMKDINGKDENGESVSGLKKERIIDYVNSLDADYGEKIILFKTQYPKDKTYNNDIIDYLNGRDDISYQQMESILKELGFEVDSEGNISW